MDGDQNLLTSVLHAINEISNDPDLDFDRKLNRVISVVTKSLHARSGSVMLKKGRNALEVVASTNPEIVGVRQSMDRNSPSVRVARTGERLYVDGSSGSEGLETHPDRYRKSAFLLVPVINHGRVIGVISMTDKIDRDEFSREEQAILLKVTGQIIGALEAQRLADDLRRKRRTLQKRNRQLRKLEALKSDLYRMLIHDLKGPLSELLANLDILSYTVSRDNLGVVESAKNSCDTLYSMVSNLLDIARLEEGKLNLVYERIDPEDLLREAGARTHWPLEQRGLSLQETRSSNEESELFWGDRGILLRVLQNLLMNAAAFSPEGGRVFWGFEYPETGVIRFAVEDRGPGVPVEHQDRIFDKYAQLEKKTDGRLYTTGLGLTFCKMAVGAHGGRIRVVSDGRKGSRFLFDIPLERGKRLPESFPAQ